MPQGKGTRIKKRMSTVKLRLKVKNPARRKGANIKRNLEELGITTDVNSKGRQTSAPSSGITGKAANVDILPEQVAFLEDFESFSQAKKNQLINGTHSNPLKKLIYDISEEDLEYMNGLLAGVDQEDDLDVLFMSKHNFRQETKGWLKKRLAAMARHGIL